MAWLDTEKAVLNGLFRFAPSWGRIVGDHSYDGIVGDASSTSIQGRVKEIDAQLSRLERSDSLSRDEDVDRRALIAQLRASRFELSELRAPWTNPLYYAGFGSELDVSAYIKRDYAPRSDRLAALRKHLSGYDGYLEAARSNLEASLPRPHLLTAIEALDGQVNYLSGELAAVAAEDPLTLKALRVAAAQVNGFADFLRGRLEAAHDDYALGSERFRRYLKIRELIDLDLPALEKMARADLDHNLARAREVAEQLAPGGGVRGALERIEAHRPTVQSIIPDVSAMLEGLRAYIIEHDLVTVPSEVRCQVKPTPAFVAFISAALDSAGPLETVATESYYYVTVPTPEWGEVRTEEWLRYLNHSMLENVSIHEAYPGHYLQSLHERLAGSVSRRVMWVQSTGEGWAHYVEEMMIEAGYSRSPRLELAQLMDALLRDCRFLCALGLHCQGMPMAAAVELFEESGFHSELPATREATRGAWDPLYLNYTLGKLLIYQLRRDLEKRPGFTLKAFHDAFLRCGNLPIPLIRELLT